MRDTRMRLVTQPHGGVLLRAVRIRFKLSHHPRHRNAPAVFARVHFWPVMTELLRRGWRQVPSSSLSGAADDTPASLLDLLHQPPPSAKQADPTDQAPGAPGDDGHNDEFRRFLEVLNKYTRLLDSVTQPPELPKELTQDHGDPIAELPRGDSSRKWMRFFDKQVPKEKPWLRDARRRLMEYNQCLGLHRLDGTEGSIAKAKAALAFDKAGPRLCSWLQRPRVRRIFEEKLYLVQ